MLCGPIADHGVRPSACFEIRPDAAGGTWTVFDTATGKVATLNNRLQSGYGIEDAAEIAELMCRLTRFRPKPRP